jgi:hypothetical protein
MFVLINVPCRTMQILLINYVKQLALSSLIYLPKILPPNVFLIVQLFQILMQIKMLEYVFQIVH